MVRPCEVHCPNWKILVHRGPVNSKNLQSVIQRDQNALGIVKVLPCGTCCGISSMTLERVLVDFFDHWAFSVFEPNICKKLSIIKNSYVIFIWKYIFLYIQFVKKEIVSFNNVEFITKPIISDSSNSRSTSY